VDAFDLVFQNVELSPANPDFYKRVCAYLSPRVPNYKTNIDELAACEFYELSERLDEAQIQESAAGRNVLKARAIAHFLVREDGEIDLTNAEKIVKKIKEFNYSLSPGFQEDAVRDEHIVHVLEQLLSDRELVKLVRYISRPVSNRLAEDIVRKTLEIPDGVPLTDVHVRRACFAAWLTYLRQSLGSCFATAPAILIQREQPHLFLKDIDEMMNTGRLRRTFGGVEYSAPMSLSWGNGDLKKPIILSKNLQESAAKVWHSPGLIGALEAVGVLEGTKTWKEKSETLFSMLKKSLEKASTGEALVVTCAEDILKKVLLQHYEITEKDVAEYQARPKGMVHSGLLLHVPKEISKNKKSKAKSCPDYLRDLQIAKNSFKMLADSALLKSWEFTVASFSEIKLQFARFNLYASLGINHDDQGGIGECVYRIISGKIEEANLYLKEKEDEYNQQAMHMRYLEQRARLASTEKEIEWIKVEIRTKQTELYHIEQQRQIAYEKAQKIGNLNEFLIQRFDEKFRDYFQEVYDAEIHEISAHPFDDSPAGFRLLYKHGRSNPSLWSLITSVTEFSEALVSFFTLVEQEIAYEPQIKGVESDCALIFTQLINHVRSDLFLESAFYRMAKAHGAPLIAKPLQNLEKIEKKPWVYTSGGSMTTLVSAYFSRDEPPYEVGRWVESETELFAFLIDTLKQMPKSQADQFLDDPKKSMLIHSPTHAFLFKPGLKLFSEGWQSDMYTYSWIKHEKVEPTQRILRTLTIGEEVAPLLFKEIEKELLEESKERFRTRFTQLPYRMSVPYFFEYVMSQFQQDRTLRGAFGTLHSDTLTEILFRSLPITKIETVKETLESIFATLFKNQNGQKERANRLLNELMYTRREVNYLLAEEVQEFALSVCAVALGQTRTRTCLRKEIVDGLRKAGLLLPEPILFADTNWVKDYFAFVVSPVTQELEFWAVDQLGVKGRPISYWKMWLNGTKREPKWGVFCRPQDYLGR
jgi:hypothetical protein